MQCRLFAAEVCVSLDLNASSPGRQPNVIGLPGNGVFQAAVSISDPTVSHALYSIGYLGGLDRGIACGHVINPETHGVVVDFSASVGQPVNPANQPFVFPAFTGAKAFDGPEVQYVEWGASQRATIQSNAPPIFTLRIEYHDALPCDTFDFYLADYVSIWRRGSTDPEAGAFSVSGPITLDTGGDAVPDGTVTLMGIDADVAVAPPSAAYWVDFVDGPPSGGPARIHIVWPGDLDGDGFVEFVDLAILLAHFGTDGAAYDNGDINGDGAVTIEDLTTLLGFFGNGCRR